MTRPTTDSFDFGIAPTPYLGDPMDDRFTSAPAGWSAATEAELKRAVDHVWVALNDEAAVDRVGSYYRRDGNYAGATFLDLDPVDPHSFTPADLLSLNLLGVAPQAVAIRRLLEPSRQRGLLLRLLREENLPLDADLAMADTDQLLAMGGLYGALKLALSPAFVKDPNPWVTASKLCARKRLDLFPVRDNVVCSTSGSSTRRATTRSTGRCSATSSRTTRSAAAGRDRR